MLTPVPASLLALWVCITIFYPAFPLPKASLPLSLQQALVSALLGWEPPVIWARHRHLPAEDMGEPQFLFLWGHCCERPAWGLCTIRVFEA